MPEASLRQCVVCGSTFEAKPKPGRQREVCTEGCRKARHRVLTARSRAKIKAIDPDRLKRQDRERDWRSHPRRGPEPGTAYADCKRCGIQFVYVIGGGRHQLYCRDDCRDEARRDRQAEYRRNNRDRVSRWRIEDPRRARDSWLRSRYGITADQYDAMLAAQGGRCAICPATEPGDGRGFLHVDHDHGTGVVRGILCSRCNLSIGKFEDDPNLLRAAAEYLERSTTWHAE